MSRRKRPTQLLETCDQIKLFIVEAFLIVILVLELGERVVYVFRHW